MYTCLMSSAIRNGVNGITIPARKQLFVLHLCLNVHWSRQGVRVKSVSHLYILPKIQINDLWLQTKEHQQ